MLAEMSATPDPQVTAVLQAAQASDPAGDLGKTESPFAESHFRYIYYRVQIPSPVLP
jgi:hypothetical protein